MQHASYAYMTGTNADTDICTRAGTGTRTLYMYVQAYMYACAQQRHITQTVVRHHHHHHHQFVLITREDQEQCNSNKPAETPSQAGLCSFPRASVAGQRGRTACWGSQEDVVRADTCSAHIAFVWLSGFEAYQVQGTLDPKTSGRVRVGCTGSAQRCIYVGFWCECSYLCPLKLTTYTLWLWAGAEDVPMYRKARYLVGVSRLGFRL